MSGKSKPPKIIAYLKPHCGWSRGVRAVMSKYGLDFEDRDIWNDIHQRVEMIQKSGQELSPCVEINGHMLADVSGEEVEVWMLEKGIVQPTSTGTDVPTDRGCSDEEHAAQRGDIPVQFKG
jgi:monothiol glutaredoxin